MAFEEVKLIHGGSPLRLIDPDGKAVSSWEAVAALLDWSARPEFWDEQDFVLVEYRPLIRLLVASSDRERTGSLPDEDHAWLSPHLLENAQLELDGRVRPFSQWASEILEKKEQARAGGLRGRDVTTMEEHAALVGERLFHYQAIRDHNGRAVKPLDLLIVPRPNDETYRKFTTEAFQKGMKPDQTLSPLAANVTNTLVEFLDGLPSKEWALPEEDGVVDQKFAVWLGKNSSWIPLGIILESDQSELAHARITVQAALVLRKNYLDLKEAERAAPGKIPEAKVLAVIAAARDLAAGLGHYPDPAAMARETQFNRLAPLSKAPLAFGCGFVMLLLSFAITAGLRTAAGKLGAALYVLGIAGFATGTSLEMYGIFLRYRIGGLEPVAKVHWVPVTNMYETVIWAALVTSLMGLAFELIWRKKYAALAASGIALLATLLAANASGLDPSIRAIPQALQSNRWIAAHVVPIVSGYGAFALALALGLLAVGHYLTENFGRSPSYRELAWPMVPGVPLFLVGEFGIDTLYHRLTPTVFDPRLHAYIRSGLAAAGGFLALVGVFSVLGEVANRSPRRARNLGLILAAAGSTGMIVSAAGAFLGLHLTPLRSSVCSIVVLLGLVLIALSVLGAHAREAPARVETLGEFIYRAMQLGALLLAVGIIMGGAWAHSAWGRFWGWDPKEVWALITLLAYLVALQCRFAGWASTFALVAASVWCFTAVLMSWYGVNFVLRTGLHSYGFAEGGNARLVTAWALAMVAFVGAAFWRRLRSR
jgi:ABC-type transport system involved in cytochrome c biogenesis permease subunit